MLRAIALTSTWILASALLLEIGLRVYVPFSNSPLFLPEKVESADETAEVELRVAQRRSTRLFGVPFNSLGFRDQEVEVPKPDDVFRTVVLADSFGVISRVPDSHFFLNLAEADLAGTTGAKRPELVNLGISAIGPHHYLAVLKRWGIWLDPDLVVVCFFLGNDFNPDPIEEAFQSEWDRLLTYRIVTRLARLARAPRPDSEPTADPAGVDGESTARSREIPAYIEDWMLETPTLPRDEFERIVVRRAWIFDPNADPARFALAVDYLERMQEIAARETGRPLVVVLVPSQAQVDPELARAIEEKRGGRLDLEQPNRYLAAALEPERFVVIDLLPALRAAHQELGRVYHLQDTHWNANGNRVAAREIAAGLRALHEAPRP
jgi:hypothetical protein